MLGFSGVFLSGRFGVHITVGVAVDTAKAWPQSEHSSAKGRPLVTWPSGLSEHGHL